MGTDQPFKSISIGGANQVWAIAKDGAVFYRGSVSQQNPAGEKGPTVEGSYRGYRRCSNGLGLKPVSLSWRSVRAVPPLHSFVVVYVGCL